MPVAGAIAERTRGILPVTWDALANDAARFGDGSLLTTIETVKEIIFGIVVDPDDEALYPLVVIDYTAKCVALELITPGIDFWMNEPISESATGTNENHSFTDRAAELRALREALLKQIKAMEPLVKPLIGYTAILAAPRPAMNTLDDDLLTPSPQEFPRPFARTERS